MAVLAVVVVLALLGAGGWWFLQRGDGPSAAGGERLPGNALSRQWEQSEKRTMVTGTKRTGLPGLWSTSQTVVYGDGGGVRGYDPATGMQKWTLKPPEHVGQPCAMSWRATANGTGAVAYDAGGGDCSVIASVDTNTGTVLWSKNLAGNARSNDPVLTVNDNMITADLGQGTLARFDARLGTPKSLPRPAPHSGDCTKGYALGDYHGVMTSDCPGEGVTVFSQLDDKGGNKTYPGNGRSAQAVLGEEPLTVLFDSDSGPAAIQTFGTDGPGPTVELTGELEKFNFSGRYRAVVGKHVLIAEYEQTDGFGALDLTTGKLLWRTPYGSHFRLVGEDHGKVLFVTDGADKAVAPHQDLVAYDLASGQRTTVGALARPDGRSPGIASSCEVAGESGRLFTACEPPDLSGSFAVDSYSTTL
ncbi:hypothetical protein KCH_60190 [Kitasatospora cheerisanensis KCTC 2395]|uniref:Pyrrolo-quinoline quinone repeat domain-containing protein n=1 Tax=Kitasatospora cheerisanensis KCTC 2395 TaxID=1348663 RepID=A0A066YWB1_9ACTN|nr:hypothetical protein KCH_60190 [Kitasatospora cheerisanensis KCTC 2395]